MWGRDVILVAQAELPGAVGAQGFEEEHGALRSESICCFDGLNDVLLRNEWRETTCEFKKLVQVIGVVCSTAVQALCCTYCATLWQADRPHLPLLKLKFWTRWNFFLPPTHLTCSIRRNLHQPRQVVGSLVPFG